MIFDTYLRQSFDLTPRTHLISTALEKTILGHQGRILGEPFCHVDDVHPVSYLKKCW